MNRSEAFSVMLAVVCIGAVLIALDLLLTPGTIWAPYALLLLILWPLGLLPYKVFSVIAAKLILLTLAGVNFFQGPAGYPWVLYALPVMWWPLSALFPHVFYTRTWAWLSFVILGLYYVGLNVLWEDRFPWSLFPIFALLWWPLTRQFVGRPLLYSIVATVATSIFLALVNLVTTPDEIWAVYPIFAIIWWPLSVYYFRRR